MIFKDYLNLMIVLFSIILGGIILMRKKFKVEILDMRFYCILFGIYFFICLFIYYYIFIFLIEFY